MRIETPANGKGTKRRFFLTLYSNLRIQASGKDIVNVHTLMEYASLNTFSLYCSINLNGPNGLFVKPLGVTYRGRDDLVQFRQSPVTACHFTKKLQSL